jgi:uncharacterized protein
MRFCPYYYTVSKLVEVTRFELAASTSRTRLSYKKALDEFVEQEKQQPNAADEFRIANMYLRGLGVEANPEEATKWLELCIEKEDPRAQYQLARMYQEGQGVQQDEAKAQELYAASLAGFLKLEQETPASHIEYKIAGMYDRGTGTEPDAVQAFTWYVKAAESGHPHAAYRVAKACYDGTGTKQDYKAAEQWFLKAAVGADPYAMYALGKMYRDGTGVEMSAETSYSYFLAAAKLEHEFAQFAVAKGLLHGIGTEQNPQEALHWFTKAAEKGNHYAKYQAAELLSVGKVVKKDEVRAQKLYAESLAGFLLQEQNEPNEQLEYRIGSMYLHSKGTQENPTEALRWFTSSADKGNSYAAYQAAELLSDGKAVPKDEVRAQKLYTEALTGFLEQERTEPNEQLEYRIGSMYFRGKGTQQNQAGALPWFLLSADKGNSYAAYQAAELFSDGKVVPKDEVRAQKLYAEALTGFLDQERAEPNEKLEYRIGSMYFHGKGTQENPVDALSWFLLSADTGNTYAAYQAAELLADGKAVPKDEVKAQKLYFNALAGFLLQEQNEPNEQLEYRIGSIYLHGKGTQPNPVEAVRWFTVSTEKGNAYAAFQAGQIFEQRMDIPNNEIQSRFFYNLALNGFIQAEHENPDDSQEFRIGQMFYRGKGTIADYAAAANWFSLSAEKGNAQAQFQLARMLQTGEGVPVNEQRAQTLYSMAFQGFMKSLQVEPDSGLQYKIGTMFEFGLGVEKSISTAKQWFTMSADAGNEFAAERLKQIESFEAQAAVSSVLGLFRAFARNMGNGINDSTTHKYRQDRKLMQKQQALKVSHGHKYDDQEQSM